MDEQTIIHYTLQALLMVLTISLPPIIVASTVGLLVSLIQAVTQVQEQTISFAVRVIAISLTMVVMARWMGAEIYNYSLTLFENIPMMK